MTLPVIPLPLPVPEVIPVLLHPAVVHFAVVLPLVIIILELINLITKRKALTITIYVLFFLLAGVYLAAYAAGVIDGKNGGLLLSDEGLAHLKIHKQIGIYLLYLSVVPIVLKLFTLAVRKPWAKFIYLLTFIGIMALTGYQAKEGGELVYKYGLNVEAKTALDDTVEELQDELDEVKEAYEEKIEALKAELAAAKAAKADKKVEAVATPEPVIEVETSPETVPEVIAPAPTTEVSTPAITIEEHPEPSAAATQEAPLETTTDHADNNNSH